MRVEHWSHSSINMITKCPRQYWYRYARLLKQPPGAAMEFGKAYHKVVENSYVSEMEGKGHLDREEAEESFVDEFATYSTGVDWSLEDNKKGALVDKGVQLTGMYVSEYAPLRKAKAVELKFEEYLPEQYEIYAPIVGFIDLVSEGDVLTDHKTASRGWSKTRLESTMQPEAYYIAFKQVTGCYPKQFTYDVAVKTKEPYIQYDLNTQRSMYQLELYYERIQQAQEMVEKELFPRTNPDNWFCSRKWCGYYGHCIRGEPLQQQRLIDVADVVDEGYAGI